MVDGYIQVAAEDLVRSECEYDEIGIWSLKNGLSWHKVTKVEIRAPRDVYIWAEGASPLALDARELVHVRKLTDKKETSVSEDTNTIMSGKSDEIYTEDDIRKAFALLGFDRNIDEKMAYLESARASRLGVMRETTVGMLNRDDHGKKIRLEIVTRSWQTLTHVKRITNVPGVFLVLDGYIYEHPEDTKVWVDDSSTPEES